MIYGTAWKKEETAKLVKAAIESGFRAIDTACQPKHYNEKGVGEGIAAALKNCALKREDIFIQTKFTPINGQDPDNIPYDPGSPLEMQIKRSLEVSLSNLQTDYLDSLILHSPLFPFKNLLKAWRVFEAFIKEGKVKQIGISNCYDYQVFEKLYKESDIKPKVLQNRFYEQSSYDKELREFCKEKNISYQSFWSLTANPHIVDSDTVTSLAQKYKKSNAQIFYKYLTMISITPLNGTTSKEHMEEDLSIYRFEMDKKEIEKINRLIEGY